MTMGARLGNLLVLPLVLALLVGGVRLADRHNLVVDLSRDGRSSLDAASVAALAVLAKPLEIVCFVPANRLLRQGLADYFARYRRHKPDLVLRFIDGQENLDAAQEFGAKPGDLFAVYDGRRERLKSLATADVVNTFARLGRGTERFITFLSGHGERRVAREANHDLSRFAGYLASRGLKLHEYVPGSFGNIPDNTAVLVLASPAVAYGEREVAEINAYVARGGNLLWLTEPKAPAGTEVLERALGFSRLPGTVVDPVGLTRLGNAAYAVVLPGGRHPVLTGLNQTLALPYAAALVATPNIDWEATTIAATDASAWNETSAFEGNVGRDADDEIAAAHVLAIALTKPRATGGNQRVVVVGDGDFLSNTYVDNLGNREFGRRLLEWLAEDDALVEVAADGVPDGELDLSVGQRLAIFCVFGLGLPIAFGANGWLRWWRRRHA